jgi:hypothetical protein
VRWSCRRLRGSPPLIDLQLTLDLLLPSQLHLDLLLLQEAGEGSLLGLLGALQRPRGDELSPLATLTVCRMQCTALVRSDD